MPGRRIRRCRSRTTSSKEKQPPATYVGGRLSVDPGAAWLAGRPLLHRSCHGGLHRSSLDAGRADGLGHFGPVLHDHPPASRRLRDLVHRLDVGVGQRGFRRRGAALREQLGLDKPITVQYAKWMGLILQGNFGMAMEWGRPVSDVIGDRLTLTMVISVAAIIFTWGIALADRDLLRGLPVFVPGLRVHVDRFHRARHSRVPAGSGRHVRRLRLVRCERGRPLFARFHRGALEHGKGVGPHQAPADPGHRPWRCRNRAVDPHHALQPARRIEEALCDDGAGARTSGIPGHHAVSGPGGPQSVREHHRLPPSLRGVGQHHRLAGA